MTTHIEDSRPCPFCDSVAQRAVASNASAWALRDAFPVSLGHTLIVSRRHVRSFFDLNAGEQADLLALLREQQVRLVLEHCPAGFNVGINDGGAAGQTVPHVHVHLIPRYKGDVADPRGGVRWVLPERADYWSAPDTTPTHTKP